MKLSWRKIGNNWRIRNGAFTWWVLDNGDCTALFLRRIKGRAQCLPGY